MTKVQKVDDVEEIIAKWPRLVRLAQEDVEISNERLLQLYLTCFQNGAVFLLYNDHGLSGSCCVELDGDCLMLRSLPRDNSEGLGKTCLAAATKWAREMGVDEMRVTTTKLSGASYRYFERSLGFRRYSVTFRLDL